MITTMCATTFYVIEVSVAQGVGGGLKEGLNILRPLFHILASLLMTAPSRTLSMDLPQRPSEGLTYVSFLLRLPIKSFSHSLRLSVNI